MNQKIEELNQVMADALLKIKDITESDPSQKDNFLPVVKTFIAGIISTTVDLAELTVPGSAAVLLSDIEAVAKEGGIRAIKDKIQSSGSNNYSVSNIDENDTTTAMNYLGQKLSITLFKGLNELPAPLRNREVLLRSIEALLSNLLINKFDNPHQVLSDFCSHVEMVLSDSNTPKHSVM